MTLEVISEKENTLYDRKEVVVKLDKLEITPSRKEVLEELGKKFGHKDGIIIERIDQMFGRKEVTVSARIYAKPEDAKKYEQDYLAARTEGRKKKVQAKK